jgi:hypothetical protein
MHKLFCLLTTLSIPLLHAAHKPPEADVKTHAIACTGATVTRHTYFKNWIAWAGDLVGITVYPPPPRCRCPECARNNLIQKWADAEEDWVARGRIEDIARHLVRHFVAQVYGTDNDRMMTNLKGTQKDLDLALLEKIIQLPAHTHEIIRTACAVHFFQLIWKNNGNELINRYFISHHVGDSSHLMLPELFSLVLEYVGPHRVGLSSMLYYTSIADRSPLYLDRSHPTSFNQDRRRTNVCQLHNVTDLNGIESLDRCRVIDCSHGCEIRHMPPLRVYDAYEVPDLESLTILNLANNLIKTIPGISISQRMLTTTLPRLAHINLANNKIESFDEDFYQDLAACGPNSHGHKITIDLRNNPLNERTRKRLKAFAHVTVG